MILCGRTEYLLNFQKLLNEEGGGTDLNSKGYSCSVISVGSNTKILWMMSNLIAQTSNQTKNSNPQKFQTPHLHLTQQRDSLFYNYKYLLYQTKNILLIFFFRWRLMTIMILVFIAESLKKIHQNISTLKIKKVRFVAAHEL